MESGHGMGELEEVAIGGGEGVGGVEILGLVGEGELHLEHPRHLLLGGVAVAGDVLLYDGRFVLGERDVAAHGGGYGYTLGSSEFEHRLYVLAEEGCLDGEVVGVVGVDDGDDIVEDGTDALVVVVDFLEVEDVHGHERGPVVADGENAVAHDEGTGVDAEYNVVHYADRVNVIVW